jgi:hypothetical protein
MVMTERNFEADRAELFANQRDFWERESWDYVDEDGEYEQPEDLLAYEDYLDSLKDEELDEEEICFLRADARASRDMPA